MLGAGVNVKETKILKERLKKYKELSKKFLNARSTLICSYTTYKGKKIKPAELPVEIIKEHKKNANNWKYDIKAER